MQRWGIIERLLTLNKEKRLFGTYSVSLFVISFFLFLALGKTLGKVDLKKEADPPRVIVKSRILSDDAITLYYLLNSEQQYSDEYSVPLYIRGEKKERHIVFNLPDTRLVKKFRLDLGRNELQKEVEITSITIDYNNRELVLFDALKGINLFNIDHYVSLHDKKYFSLSPKQQDYYDPYIYTNDISADYDALVGGRETLPFPYLLSFICILSLLVFILLFKKTITFRVVFYSFASCLFIVLLLFPFMNESFHLSDNKNLEKRSLAEKPILKSGHMEEYPKQFEAYYNDNFGFRNELVKLGATIKYSVFGSSSIPSNASVGKNDWFFLSGSLYRITQDLQKSNLFTERELDSTFNDWLMKKETLGKRGIKFYKAAWPDKHYIYPEFLPFVMSSIKKDSLSRCDQLINRIEESNSQLHLIDVRKDLIKEKKRALLYSKYDSHWNSFGAFFGYSALMNEMQKEIPELKPIELKEFKITWEYSDKGDLAILMGLGLKELSPVFMLKNDSSVIVGLSGEGFPPNTYIIQNEKSRTGLTALVYRDSFTWALIPFLQHHFKKMVFVSDVTYSTELVEKVKPDVVIECYATRYFR